MPPLPGPASANLAVRKFRNPILASLLLAAALATPTARSCGRPASSSRSGPPRAADPVSFVDDRHSFSLLDIDGNRLTFRQLDEAGSELDRFVIQKR
jgi:hypothetical protein